MAPQKTSREKILFVSYMGLILDAAWRAQSAGYEVKLSILEEKYREVGQGMIPQCDNWEKEVSWADVIVFDDTLGFGPIAERLRASGKRVIGGSSYTDRLEDDRAFGQAELKAAGVKILGTEQFDSYDAGIQFVRRNPRAYVLKPCGAAANQKKLLYVGEEAEGADVIRMLEHYRESESSAPWAFQLQDKVIGIEVGVSAFFDGQKFLSPVSVAFEHKRLFPQELGPQTGEMGTSMFWAGHNKLFRETLGKMRERLAQHGYCGIIDVNCIVNAAGIFPLEFTCRFGFPTILIHQEGMGEPLAALLCDMTRGARETFAFKPGFQIGVQVRVPPFPYKDPQTFNRLSRDLDLSVPAEGLEGLHPQDVKVKDGKWLLAGEDGCPFIVCASADTMRAAQDLAYARVRALRVPNAFYRDDIGDRWYDKQEVDKLLTWGYLN